MIKWAWENVGAQGIDFDPYTEEEESDGQIQVSVASFPGPSLAQKKKRLMRGTDTFHLGFHFCKLVCLGMR